MPTCKILWAFSLTLFILSPLASLDFPSMPSISEPTMPTMDGKPYVGQPPYIPQAPNTRQQSQTESEQQNSTETASTVQETETSILSDTLTAQTISGLGGLSSLTDTLSALTSTQNVSSYLPALSKITGTNTSPANSNATLESILKELQKLSQQNNGEGTASQNTTDDSFAGNNSAKKTAPGTSSSETASAKNTSGETDSQSKILRFRVNNSDILNTCQTIYFSQPEEEGLFLLTGDRSFYIDNKPCAETFYFLFKPALDEKGLFYYEVEGEIMQNTPLPGSKLYPLTERPKLTARKTGNLITLKHSSENWNLDMLIDLREFR